MAGEPRPQSVRVARGQDLTPPGRSPSDPLGRAEFCFRAGFGDPPADLAGRARLLRFERPHEAAEDGRP